MAHVVRSTSFSRTLYAQPPVSTSMWSDASERPSSASAYTMQRNGHHAACNVHHAPLRTTGWGPPTTKQAIRARGHLPTAPSRRAAAVQCSAVQSQSACSAVQRSAAQSQSACSAVQCSAVQCSAAQRSAVQSQSACSAVQCSAVQCSAVQSQCRAAQRSAAQRSAAQRSAAHTVQCSAVQLSAAQRSAAQCSAVQRCAAHTVQCSAVQCSAVQRSAVQCSAVTVQRSAAQPSAQLSSGWNQSVRMR